MGSIKKNFIYSMIYQLLILFIPLLTAPYLSRIIGAEGVGIYSYTYSIVYYFMLITLLGVNNYGNRAIAKIRDNPDELSKTFWSIYIFQLFMGIIMIGIYVIYILLFNSEYRIYSLIEIVFIISAIFDINWFFFGMEEFKKTIIRNTFIKVINVVLIFLLVKNVDDLWIYTLIMACMALLGQIVLWFFLKDKIKPIKVSLDDIKKHIKPNLILFIPVIAVSLYKMMDKIMLGSIYNVIEVGYYENAEKIINIPLALITALGTVMLPRVTNLLSKGSFDAINRYIGKSIRFIMFISFAMCFGLIVVGFDFAPVFFGKEFQKTGILIILLSTTLPFISFANVIRTQYLIPREKDKIYLGSVLFGAMTNLIMNFIFIPMYGSVGACIGTIVAESTVMIYQTILVRNDLPVGDYIIKSLPFLLKSILMGAIIYLINFLNIDSLLKIIIQVIIGCLVYFMLNIRYIFSIINIKRKRMIIK